MTRTLRMLNIERKGTDYATSRPALVRGLTKLQPERVSQVEYREQVFSTLATKLTEDRRSKNRQVVILIKINHLCQVNDSKEFSHGDRVLAELTRRFSSATADPVEIFQTSVDEVVVLPRATAYSVSDTILTAVELAKEFRRLAKHPVTFGNHVYSLSASVGISVARGNMSAIRLFQQADLALQYAVSGKDADIQVFHPTLLKDARNRSKLDADLQEALRTDQFVCFAQPQIQMRDGCAVTTGYELLVRWNHPEQGLLAPQQFICHAEQAGMIQNIDLWVLRQAVEQVKSWIINRSYPKFRLSVNLSRQHFCDPSFPARISEIIGNCPEVARRLTLEVTETMVLEDMSMARLIMLELRHMGFSLSLDDFGTGFSSLTLIRNLPFTELKIDQSFVTDLPGDLRAGEIVSNMIQLARALKIELIAEGVENHEQLGWLLDHGCDCAQGYLFGRPMPFYQ